jgi:hypothetical protein
MSDYTPAQIRTGNRRLLKLADVLDAVPLGMYDQTNILWRHQQANLAEPCAMCAMSYAYLNQRAFPGLNEFEGDTYFKLADGQWDLLFGVVGCGNARTAKQAAKYIRKFVAKRGAL